VSASTNDVYSGDFVSKLDPTFGNWAAPERGFGPAAQRRAIRRLKFWQSKSAKKPTVDDMIRAVDQTETASSTCE
jgi:hypothetical protein